jgi:cyanophycin synthetase
MAAPGDLILVLADGIKRTWKQIIYFNSEAKDDDVAKKATVTIDLPETDAFSFDDDIEIISDERGVRIAKEAGD